MKHEAYINNWFANWQHRFDTSVPYIVAETATEFYKERFKTEEWEGVPWKPLNPKYKASKKRGKDRILYATSNLLQTIKPAEVNQKRVVISAGSTKAPYARVHNEGLRITGDFKVKEYTNTNFFGTGKRQLIKSHTRRVNFKMPKRQFMGHSPILNRIIIDRLTQAFKNR